MPVEFRQESASSHQASGCEDPVARCPGRSSRRSFSPDTSPVLVQNGCRTLLDGIRGPHHNQHESHSSHSQAAGPRSRTEKPRRNAAQVGRTTPSMYLKWHLHFASSLGVGSKISEMLYRFSRSKLSSHTLTPQICFLSVSVCHKV